MDLKEALSLVLSKAEFVDSWQRCLSAPHDEVPRKVKYPARVPGVANSN